MKVIDLSYHNGTVDFDLLKKHCDSVILRVGFGVSGTMDKKFLEYYGKARKAGLKIGGYWYSYALTAAKGEQEAKNCLNILQNKSLDLPLYIDMEDADNYKKKKGFPTKTVLTNICKTFCEYIEKHSDYVPGIYASTDWFKNKGIKNCPEKWTRWEANYGKNTGVVSTVTPLYNSKNFLHQYTSNYKINGKRYDMSQTVGTPFEQLVDEDVCPCYNGCRYCKRFSNA